MVNGEWRIADSWVEKAHYSGGQIRLRGGVGVFVTTIYSLGYISPMSIIGILEKNYKLEYHPGITMQSLANSIGNCCS